jgi:hypothetical protein
MTKECTELTASASSAGDFLEIVESTVAKS